MNLDGTCPHPFHSAEEELKVHRKAWPRLPCSCQCTLKPKSKSNKHFSRKRLREQLLHSSLWQAATNERSQLVQACGCAQDMFSRMQKAHLQQWGQPGVQVMLVLARRGGLQGWFCISPTASSKWPKPECAGTKSQDLKWVGAVVGI